MTLDIIEILSLQWLRLAAVLTTVLHLLALASLHTAGTLHTTSAGTGTGNLHSAGAQSGTGWYQNSNPIKIQTDPIKIPRDPIKIPIDPIKVHTQ